VRRHAGLFHGAIAQSGVATAPYSVYGADDDRIDFRQYVRDVGRLFSCTDSRLHDVIACLRRVSTYDIIAKRGSVRPPTPLPCLPSSWINGVPAATRAGVRAGDAASAGWQVTLCDDTI